MKVTFNRHAANELADAAQHLQIEANLGSEFLDEYEAWEKQVTKHPLSCPEIAPDVRLGYLKRFKYYITYTIVKNMLRILYVRHTRSAPITNRTRK